LADYAFANPPYGLSGSNGGGEFAEAAQGNEIGKTEGELIIGYPMDRLGLFSEDDWF
jgi:hypothetical protein